MTDAREEVAEIVPCPYVNGFGSDSDEVSFILKKYDGYSDFIIFDNGKPCRCFRFKADSNNKYVPMLVEALKRIAESEYDYMTGRHSDEIAQQALNNLPEELRG